MTSAFIQGLSPVFPILVIAGLAIFSLFLSWWSYKHLVSIVPLKRYSLIALRATSLFILLLLLLNPFFVRENTDTDNPRIAVYIDNSQSLSIARGEYSGLQSYTDLVRRFQDGENSNFEYDYYLFDDEIYPYDYDELSADGFRTNLNSVIEHIRERETDYRASVIFSDGIITTGRDPVFASQNLSIPLITVPVGDTTEVRDIAVADVNYIQTVYTQTQQTITVEVQQQGFGGEETVVQLLQDGQLIDSGTLSFGASTSSQNVEFEREFTEPGFFDYEINIPVKENEFTDQNNRVPFTIEVLEDKTNILSIAFEVHPDVGSIRRLIATDQQNELFSSTYLGENRFVGTNPVNMDEEIDLVVLHGVPPSTSSIFEWLQNREIPILYVATPGSYQRHSNPAFLDLAAYTLSGNGQPASVRVESFQSSLSHPVLELDQSGIQRLPSLQTVLGNYELSPLAQTLITGQYRSVESGIPILFVEDASANRRASVNAFGWYRFEQNQNPDTRQFFEQLFTNLVSWTSTSPDRRNLSIEPVKPVYSENETVEIRATLFNERGEPEPDAIIELEVLYDNNRESNFYRMTHRENEVYAGEIGNYPQGIYRVRATATKNNRTLGRAETRVQVSQSSAEYLDTKRNDQMLRRLAEFTDGFFVEGQSLNSINEFIAENDLETAPEELSEELVYFHYSGWWFFIVLVLLSAEWLLRRSVSLP